MAKSFFEVLHFFEHGIARIKRICTDFYPAMQKPLAATQRVVLIHCSRLKSASELAQSISCNEYGFCTFLSQLGFTCPLQAGPWDP